MTNKHAERLLKENGFLLLRNGSKHALWIKGNMRITVAHGKMSPGAVRHLERKVSK